MIAQTSQNFLEKKHFSEKRGGGPPVVSLRCRSKFANFTIFACLVPKNCKIDDFGPYPWRYAALCGVAKTWISAGSKNSRKMQLQILAILGRIRPKCFLRPVPPPVVGTGRPNLTHPRCPQIGRASCRERV